MQDEGDRRASGATQAPEWPGPLPEGASRRARGVRQSQNPSIRARLSGRERNAPAIRQAGAYGFVMSSHYNTRTGPAEVLVEGDSFRLIRRRETYDDLVVAERDAAQ